jgi:hypothetical protein
LSVDDNVLSTDLEQSDWNITFTSGEHHIVGVSDLIKLRDGVRYARASVVLEAAQSRPYKFRAFRHIESEAFELKVAARLHRFRYAHELRAGQLRAPL